MRLNFRFGAVIVEPHGGKKGTPTLVSFDCGFKVIRQMQEPITFACWRCAALSVARLDSGMQQLAVRGLFFPGECARLFA